MATDNFAATNNPLASPWVAGGGAFGNFESTGGVARVSVHDVVSAMVYSTSTATKSQCTVAAKVAGFCGPALIDPATGNGYAFSRSEAGGGEVHITKYAAGVFNADSGTVAFVVNVNDVLRIYFSGGNVIISVNGVDKQTYADSTYRAGCQPGLQGENQGDTVDDWTDGAAAGVVPVLGRRIFVLP